MLGLAPNGTRPIASLPAWRVHVTAFAEIEAEDSIFTVIRASTEYMITRVSDTPPNVMFEATLEASLRVDRTIITSDGFGGFAQNVSELSLINADGLYDDAAGRNSINGQEIVCSVGEMVAGVVIPYAEFEVIARLSGERWRVNRSRLTIETRDVAAALDLPVQTSIYAGTGGLEGDAEIANKRRPYGDGGGIFNATPTQVIGAEGLWQYSTGASLSLDAVKDGGIELTFVADYATVVLLRAANVALAIPPGSYGSCIAESYFCIGGAAFKQITCDFTGLNSTTADIIEAVALNSAGLSADDLDAWTFEELNAAQPAPRVYYLDSESSETCREMFDKFTKGAGAIASVTTLGKLQVRRFEAPVEIASEYYDINGGNLIEIDRADLPAGVDPPPQRRRVSYAHNWTQQTDLYGQVSEGDPALADYLSKPYKLASTSDAQANAVLADYPYAPNPDPVEGYFVNASGAQAEAERLHVLYLSGYKAYRGVLKNALFMHQIGEVVNVRDSSVVPRLSLADGKYIRLVEVNDDTKTRQTEVIGVG